MPTFRHGKNTIVSVGAYDLSRFFNSASVSNAVDMVDSTTFGAEHKSYVVGQKDGSISFEGFWTGATGEVDEALTGALGGNAPSPVTYGPEGNAIGRRARLLLANETSYEISSSIGDLVTISAETQATEGLDGGVLLAAQQSVSATIDNTGVSTEASINGGVAHLHITDNSRDGVAIIKVQHSSDGLVWVDLVTFADITPTTVSSERVVVAPNTAINKYLRTKVFSLGGSIGSLTITVGFARR